jgi:hypothetical protein
MQCTNLWQVLAASGLSMSFHVFLCVLVSDLAHYGCCKVSQTLWRSCFQICCIILATSIPQNRTAIMWNKKKCAQPRNTFTWTGVQLKSQPNFACSCPIHPQSVQDKLVVATHYFALSGQPRWHKHSEVTDLWTITCIIFTTQVSWFIHSTVPYWFHAAANDPRFLCLCTWEGLDLQVRRIRIRIRENLKTSHVPSGEYVVTPHLCNSC